MPDNKGYSAYLSHLGPITRNRLEWGEIVQFWQPLATGIGAPATPGVGPCIAAEPAGPMMRRDHKGHPIVSRQAAEYAGGRSPCLVSPSLFLLCGEPKSVCSFLFLKNDSHGFTSGVTQPVLERGVASPIGLLSGRDVRAMAQFTRPGSRGGAGVGGQFLPSPRRLGNIKSHEFSGWNGKAHVLGVGLRPIGNADTHYGSTVAVSWQVATP